VTPLLPARPLDEIAPARAQRGFALRVACASALALASCGGGDAPLPPAAPTQPPLARLWLPILAPPVTALALDASDSQSPGGELAEYTFDFGDGSPAATQGTPIAQHAYAAEGVYAVQLSVTDLSGNAASVQSELTVRDDPPTCASDGDCDPGDRCDQVSQVCFTEVGSATGSAARSAHR
jgi:hypothetical protein